MWINRINSLFMGCLGILSGTSVMHIILLAIIKDDSLFISMYVNFALVFNLLFLILSNFCLIFGITIALIYKQKSEEC